MPGIRIHHPSLRNCTYTLVHEGRPLTRPMRCPVCQQVHWHKTYHLALDGMGDVVVSEVVLARLREAGLGDLKVIREIKKPDPQVVDTTKLPNLTVVSRENGDRPIREG